MKHFLGLLLITLFSSAIAQKAVLDIDNNDSFSGFELYKDSLAKYTVFINGENHQYTKSNASLQLKTLKYLHKNAGVKTLLLELGWSRGYIITEYIQGGDTTLLKSIKGYSWKYYADLVQDLKKYNDSLPQEQKISVVGIDVERFNNMSIKAMQMQMPKRGTKIPHDSIEVGVESLEALNFYLETTSEWDDENNKYAITSNDGPNAKRTINFLLENIKNHKDKYEAYIDSANHEVFFKVVNHLVDKQLYEMYDNANATQAYVYREQYMYKQFMDLFKQDTTQKYFMQFGRCHSVKVYQKEACTWFNYYSIANRINETSNPGLKGKVLSTAIYYPKSDAWGDLEDSLKKHVEEVYLDSSSVDSLTIWNVRLDSVFQNRHDFIIINKNIVSKDKDPKATKSWADSDFDDEGEDIHFMLDFKYGVSGFNYSNLNYALNSKLYGDFTRRNIWGFEMSVMENKSLYSSLAFTGVANQKISNGSGDIKVTASYFHFDMGFDCLGNKKLDLIPYLGLGTESINLKEKSNQIQGIFINSDYTSEANSTTFNSRIGTRFQFKVKSILLGVDANYSSNIGKAKWKENQKKISNGPQMNTRGLLLSSYIGVYF